MDTAIADLRDAVRRLRRTPAFSAVVTLTLALGIGAAIAIFGAIDPIVLRSLPYPDADRLVSLSDVNPGGGPFEVTFGTYDELAARSRSFEALAAVDRWQPAITGAAEPDRLAGLSVTAGYFRVLGVRPAVGRDLVAADDVPHGPRVVVISDRLARRRVGAETSAVGRPIVLDGEQYLIVGVMPRDFVDVLGPGADVWRPRQFRPGAAFDGAEWGHHMRLVGRLVAGVTAARAARELGAIAAAPVAEFARPPWASLRRGLIVSSLQEDVTREVRPALYAMAGAVCLVLLIACVNAASLLLGQSARRRGEIALRLAIGAGEGRIARQLITETLLLAAAGGLLGLALAAAALRALTALAPDALPRAAALHLDPRAYGFALALTIGVGILVGLVPAMHATRGDIARPLRHAARTTTRHQAARRVLVVVQVALAIVLLVSAGLLLRSLERLFAVSPGFDPSHVVTMQIDAAGDRRASGEARARLFDRVLDAVEQVPGVRRAGLTSQLPLSGDLDAYGIVFESVAGAGRESATSALRYAVSPGYFDAMRIPLRAGRLLDDHDRADAPMAVLVNEAFARRVFRKRSAVGERVRIGPMIDDPARRWATIVGVVGDVKQSSLALGEPDAFYVTREQWAPLFMDGTFSLVAAADGDPDGLAGAVRRAVRAAAPDEPILRVTTMTALVARSEAQRRFALVVFEAFAVAALVLATIGLYAVLAGGVTDRLREIGIRAALGASRENLVALVVGQAMALVLVGFAAGFAGAAAATRGLRSLMFGVSALDPLTYAAVVVLLVVMAIVASAVPAWRAVSVDPVRTLRAE